MEKKWLKAIEAGNSMHDHCVDALAYYMNDIQITNDCWNFINVDIKNMSIKKVIFNNPATIVIWSDNTKTVVKCSKDDTFDPEKGLAMAISKRIYGDNFKKIFKEWLPKEEKIKPISVQECIKAIKRALDTPMSFSFGIDKTNKESETFIEIKQLEGLAIDKINE